MKTIGIVLLLLTLSDTVAWAKEPVETAPLKPAPLKLPLWEGVPPGSETFTGDENYLPEPRGWLTGVSQPTITVYRPSAERSTGAAIVIFPGGGYGGQAIDKEGYEIARWLCDRGVVGVVASYRCGGGVHQHPVPMNDAQRAVQLVRSKGTEWGIDPAKIGVMGFSAGGHLAATVTTQWLDADSSASEPLRRVTSCPDFAVLVYGVISLREGVTHNGSRQNLLGDKPTEALIAALSADERVTDKTPPTFLVHSADDKVVPLANSQRFYAACLAHNVPAELHIYESGGHGYGMREGGPNWAVALEAWLASRDLAIPKK